MSPVTVINAYQYVYVLLCADTKFYTGCTSDLRARFSQHQEGKVLSTKHRGPYSLIYYEACMNSGDAYAREKYLKSGMGKRYLNNRLKRALAVTG